LNSTAKKKVCFQRDPKGSILFENRPVIQITRISTRDAAAGAAAEAAAEPAYDAPAAGAAAAAEPAYDAPEPVSAGAAVPVSHEPGPERVWQVRLPEPDHAADPASETDRATAAERPAPRRRWLQRSL